MLGPAPIHVWDRSVPRIQLGQAEFAAFSSLLWCEAVGETGAARARGACRTAAVAWDSSHDLGQASSALFLHRPFGFFCRWQQERTGSP